MPAGTKPGERERRRKREGEEKKKKKEYDRIPNLALWDRVRAPNFIQSRV